MQVKISAPEGSYNAGARGITVVVKSAPTARLLSLDGKPLAAAGAGDKRAGWMKSGNDLVIQITDDSKAHTIQIR